VTKLGDLTKDFSLREFRCKCGCGFDDIDDRVVQWCQELRDAMHEPITVNSGCRCEKHNKAVGSSSPNHISGKAVDLDCQSGAKALFEEAKELYSQGKLDGLEFCYLEGGANGWLHMDCHRKRNTIFQVQ
jgi:uncharacterized protein YcbK (DUF882 family)